MDSVALTNPASANLASSNVPSANPGLANALQPIGNSTPALASLLSWSSVKSALQQAPPADLVKLSDQALQLEATNGLFGTAGTAQPDPDSALTSLLAQLRPSIPVSSTSRPAVTAAAPAPSVASQLGIFEGQLEAENTQALFASSAAAASGSKVNLLG
jgi:hypothetical protein